MNYGNPYTPPKKHTGLKVLGGIVAGFFVFGLGVAVGSAGSVSTVAPSSTSPTRGLVTTLATPAPQPGPKIQVVNGTFQVGTDVVAGQWRTDGPGSDSLGSCYWGRERNDSGDFSAIIANDNISGPTSITVNAGEFVKFSGGCTWRHS
jgi:hypothetical protein